VIGVYFNGYSGPGNDLFFNNLSVSNGLSNNFGTSIAQDKNGFIWIGTSNGLNRYDGNTFTWFNKNSTTNSIVSDEITFLLADDSSGIYIGTWDGLSYLNTETFLFTTIELGFNKRIRVLMKDSSGFIWIGTDTGLLRFDPTTKTYLFYSSENSNLSHSTIRSLYEDKRGDLWVGTFDKLNKLEKGKSSFTSFDLKGNYKPSLKNNLIPDIKPCINSNDTLLWIGTETGLCLFNTNSGKYTNFTDKNSALSNEVIKSIFTGEKGEVWLGTDFGLNILNPETGEIRSLYHNPTLPYSISNNVISNIFIDNTSLIWLVTPNGVSRYNRFSSFFNYLPIYYCINDNIVGNEVKDIITEQDSIYWLATMHGVIRYNVRTKKQVVFDNSPENKNRIALNNVNTICDDKSGKIWIGTAGGINIWDTDKKKMSAIYADFKKGNGIKSNYINKFIFGADGSFWVSTWDVGLYKAIDGFDSPENLKFRLVSNITSNMITTGKDALWIIDLQNYFYRIDLKTLEIKQINKFDSLSHEKRVFLIYYSLKGDIWLGTQGGVYEYNISADSFSFHRIFPGSSSPIINITEDNQGNIWTSSYSSIAKLDTQNGKVESFPIDFDLPLKGFIRGCSARTPNGQLIFGGENGVLTFNPDDLSITEYNPEIFITKIKINNKEIKPGESIDGKVILDKAISFQKSLVFDNSQRSFTLEFSSLYYWLPSQNSYSYKLEGFDSKWNEVSGHNNAAIYSNLSPGKYTFKVKGTNNKGEWSEKFAELKIQIKPPIWANPWVILLYILGFVGISAGAFIYYDNRIKWQNELKVIRLEKEHTEELSMSKQQLFTNISHEFRTPLTLIIGSVEELLKNINPGAQGSRLISLIEKNSRRLLWLNNQLLDFSKLENNALDLHVEEHDIVGFSREIYELFSDKASRKQIHYQFKPGSQEITAWFDPGKMETILFNLLANAFKFTPRNGNIIFEIAEDKNPNKTYLNGFVRLKITDSGIGISHEDQARIFDTFYQAKEARKMERGSGIGLTLVKEFIKMHHGEILLESTAGKGSSFAVILPLGNLNFPPDSIGDVLESPVLLPKTSVKIHEEPFSYTSDLSSKKPVILLVEDDHEILDFLFLSLREKYNLVIAENGEEGVKKALAIIPDLVISNIMMPEMDGLALCKTLKNNPKTAHTSIVLISAQHQDLQKIEGLKSGADAYLTKPFTIDLLENQIDNLIKRNKELVEHFHKEQLLTPKEITPESSDEKLLKTIMEFIEKHMADENLSIEMLSKQTGFGHQYIYRKVKTNTGETLNEFIRNIRIKRAAQLLRTKKLNVSEVMAQTGFTNHSYFSKCFKKVYKSSPTEYPESE
jgi:signal transduction histidine kinase/ligand-binding sensor domain-containing protein/DNA-binding response OmpR family regulator